MIQIRALVRTFSEGGLQREVLAGVDLHVPEGEIVVLLGRSGSGKSTLLNLISGIDSPDSGVIEIGGTDLTNMSEADRTRFRRKNIGFVFQFFNLIPTLNVLENLYLPLELNGIRSSENEQRAMRLLKEIGLEGRAESFPDVLSGGEQQRVAIARALVHSPRLLLADEPTGNLDKQTGLEVLAVLDEQVRKAKRTMIMATHSQEVIGLADRILTFRDGELVETSASDVS